jgi:hypothetical protein
MPLGNGTVKKLRTWQEMLPRTGMKETKAMSAPSAEVPDMIPAWSVATTTFPPPPP